jgi:hypothetical protein
MKMICEVVTKIGAIHVLSRLALSQLEFGISVIPIPNRVQIMLTTECISESNL